MQTGLIVKVLIKFDYIINTDQFNCTYLFCNYKMTAILEASITKLARYDEGSLLAPILSLTVRIWHFIETNFIIYV
jgi:hypothetical protein